ncbi:MAG: hypothetical protein KDD51_04620 [Bdellovibrionales bacterium]|nr:hypothetical protein [Bdellovibrionales bacterium]
MRIRRFDIQCCIVLILLFAFPAESFAKRDFKGLFGNYRRDQFVENEARDTDFGVNILLATLLPLSSFVRSSGGSPALADEAMHYAAFFNVELEFTLSLFYRWQLFARIGYHTFRTEREQEIASNVQYHIVDVTAIPGVLGVRYRFSRGDVVPFLGVGVGLSYVERKSTYDYNATAQDLRVDKVLTGELAAGVEFYFGARAGLRLEVAGYYMNLPAHTYKGGATLQQFTYTQNPISLRYASGLFVLF